jgi:HAMP domain-containing protein
MSAVITILVALITGVLASFVTGWLTGRIERRKHIAQLASDAFIDAVRAMANSAHHKGEPHAEFTDAKVRLAAYGSTEVNEQLATIERIGRLDGSNPSVQECLTKVVLALRKENGLGKPHLSGEDVRVLLFGKR